MQEMWVWFLGQEDPLEKEMATHSSPSTAFHTLVDYDGYSISSKGFLPTVVDLMVIWVKFIHSSPFQFTDS